MKLHQPVIITVTDTEQLDALRHALEVCIDIQADTLTDDIPFNPSDIREMAQMSDDGIRETLRTIRESVNRQSLMLEGLQSLLQQLPHSS